MAARRNVQRHALCWLCAARRQFASSSAPNPKPRAAHEPPRNSQNQPTNQQSAPYPARTSKKPYIARPYIPGPTSQKSHTNTPRQSDSNPSQKRQPTPSHLRAPHPNTLTDRLKYCLTHDRPSHAWRLFRTLTLKNAPQLGKLTSSNLASLLRYILQKKFASSPNRYQYTSEAAQLVLNVMMQHHIEATPVLLRYLLRCFPGDLEIAEQVVEYWRAKGDFPPADFWPLLMTTFVVAGDAARVDLYLTKSVATAGASTAPVHLVKVYARVGDLGKMEEVAKRFLAVEGEGADGDMRVIHERIIQAVSSAFAKVGKFDSAWEFIEIAQRRGLTVHGETYLSLMRFAIQHGNWDLAEKALLRIPTAASFGNDVKAPPLQHTAAAELYAGRGDVQNAWSAVQNFPDFIKVDVKTLRALGGVTMKHFESEGWGPDYTSGVSITAIPREVWRASGMHVNPLTLRFLMRCYRLCCEKTPTGERAARMAESVFLESSPGGRLGGRDEEYGLLVGAYARCGRMRDAERWVGEMRGKGIKVPARVWADLVGGWWEVEGGEGAGFRKALNEVEFWGEEVVGEVKNLLEERFGVLGGLMEVVERELG
ncbi:hypothetical protein HDV00_001762 [Rhizophlyctis rosea]|nr:hypothetical protein HDV00_001762 [Rhizophlyctis rosea]